MAEFDIPMFPRWGVGDTRQLDDWALDRVYETDRYDSYDRTYIIDGARWKITHETHQADGRCMYTLQCTAVGVTESE